MKESKDEKVPVFYHLMPTEICAEMMHGWDMPAVINLTESDGSWAMAAIRSRRPYCGVCFTEAHAKAIESRLKHLVFVSMQTESDPLHQPGLAELVGKTTDDEPTPKPAPKKKAAASGGRAALLQKLKKLATEKGGKPEEEDDEEEDSADE